MKRKRTKSVCCKFCDFESNESRRKLPKNDDSEDRRKGGNKKLRYVGKQDSKDNIHFKVRQTFVLPFDPECMAITKDETVWIADTKNLIEVDLKNGMKKLNEFSNVHCIELSLSSKHELYGIFDNQVRKVTKMGIGKKVCDFSPYTPITFNITQRDEIVASLEMDPSKRSSRIRKPASKFVVLGLNGKVKDEYFFDISRRLIGVGCNSLLKAASNGFIYYTYQPLEDDSKIKMVNKWKEIVWEYPASGPKAKEFIPIELIETRLGYLIIADRGGNTLHILDMNGRVIDVIDVTQFGLTRPGLLVLDNDGYLWVEGLSSVNDEESILCVLEFGGC
ncbi:Hypothetical predicted protein [Mytilus galloprovincialis]|uniref:Uncharacterized protein n=1 Tax=Mytilus galloprovincialis TaxID=29158 RepID=A0A8B6EA42_MYTGA|nr:Hypothetical predicted protein [Mytilus galloprovincialis]